MTKEEKEQDLVRELARKVAEIAAEPRMAAIAKRWRDVNALRKPDRAPVWCRPVGCWKEILPADLLGLEQMMVDKVRDKYCIMWRQKASDVVFPDDDSQVRSDLLEGAKRLEGAYYQIVLRELETLAGHPDRLHKWTAYAKEAAAAYV